MGLECPRYQSYSVPSQLCGFGPTILFSGLGQLGLEERKDWSSVRVLPAEMAILLRSPKSITASLLMTPLVTFVVSLMMG